jgi:hypothetical protein
MAEGQLCPDMGQPSSPRAEAVAGTETVTGDVERKPLGHQLIYLSPSRGFTPNIKLKFHCPNIFVVFVSNDGQENVIVSIPLSRFYLTALCLACCQY